MQEVQRAIKLECLHSKALVNYYCIPLSEMQSHSVLLFRLREHTARLEQRPRRQYKIKQAQMHTEQRAHEVGLCIFIPSVYTAHVFIYYTRQ